VKFSLYNFIWLTDPVGQFVQSPRMRAELLRILENMLQISRFPARGVVAELKMVWQGYDSDL
jgi:hypothetical protein